MSELPDLIRSTASPSGEFAYVDDSGDPGWGKGSATFGLGCVIVPMDRWTERLDLLTEMRRGLRKDYGLKMRDECKGEWIAGVKKQFRDNGYGDGQLRNIYQRHLRTAALVCSRAFAVIFTKEEFTTQVDLEERAWEFLLQRLRYRSVATGSPIILVHDNGSNNSRVRAHMRRFRRHSFLPGGTPTRAPLLIEDPIPRDSQHSYFVQLADMAAYAASRRVKPNRGRASKICGHEMWDEFGDIRAQEVTNSRSDGIVTWRK